MRTIICTALMAFLLVPAGASAYSWKDESGKGRHRGRGYWKEQEKAWKEARKHEKKWRKEQRKRAERYGYGDEDFYPGEFGRRRFMAYPPDRRFDERDYDDWNDRRWVPPYRDDRRYEDDRDAIYTPWGYYEEGSPYDYDEYGRRLKGHGQIGPYHFDIWD